MSRQLSEAVPKDHMEADEAPAAIARNGSAEVLAAVERALVPLDLLEDAAVLTAPPQLHTRSTIYFVGDRAHPSVGCLFVVKQPNEHSTQEDLPDPLGAEAQFEAQARLARHFDAVSSTLRVPRPVALLPEVGAFAMEYIHGRDVTQYITWRALLLPDPLFNVVRLAARFLRHIHSIDEAAIRPVDLRALAREPLLLAEAVMAPLGLAFPPEVTQTLDAVPKRSVPAPVVRLHGDFAPVNVIADASGHATGIDAAFDTIGFPENDLARFLAMFSTERRFVVAQRAATVQRARRQAEDAFVASYYRDAAVSPLLEIHRIDALGRRWVRRHAARRRGRPVLASARARVVDAYFRTLLRESAERLSRQF
jgi:aminoglycoside phosphotransferase (APT) family kinase protein